MHPEGKSRDYIKYNHSKICLLSKRLVLVSVLSNFFTAVCYSTYSVEADDPNIMAPDPVRATLPTLTHGRLYHGVAKWEAKEIRSQAFSFLYNCLVRHSNLVRTTLIHPIAVAPFF